MKAVTYGVSETLHIRTTEQGEIRSRIKRFDKGCDSNNIFTNLRNIILFSETVLA